MTCRQAEAWESNVNVLVADEEEDTFSVRTSGELLLEEAVKAPGGPSALAAAIAHCLTEAASLRVGSHAVVMCIAATRYHMSFFFWHTIAYLCSSRCN